MELNTEMEHELRNKAWLNTLANVCGCHPDSEGCMPCDYGCVCDRCMSPAVDAAYEAEYQKLCEDYERTQLKPMYNTRATGRQWMLHLGSDEVNEVLEYREDELLSTSEVLEAIVSYRGGLASGYEVAQLINDIYDIDLENHDDLHWMRGV